MSVRQDKVQISIAFLTDESKAFAKLVEENKKFISDIKTARKEGKDLTDTIKNMVESGKKIAQIPLDKLAPTQLILRAQQLKQVLDLIPKSTPEYKLLEAEYKNINNELTTMRQRTKGVSDEMNKARTEGGSFFRSLTSFIASATVAFYGLKQVASAIFKPSQLASEMEQAMIAFETMLGSARNARKLVNDIVKTAANTPFEQKELIEYTKRLLAMGIESNKLIPTITALGDISAGVGKEKLPQIVLAFGQVAAKTKLAGGELKQFVEAGVPLVATLATQFNVSKAEIFKMTEAGKIGFKDVEKAIQSLTTEGGKFAGLMGKQAQTTDGLISTLKDNISIALTAFGDGFNVAFKEILRSTTAFSNGLDTAKLREWGQAVGSALKFIIEFTPTLLKLVAVFATFKIVSAASSAIQSFTTALKASETIQLLFNNGLARTILFQTTLNRLWTTAAIPFWGAAIAAATIVVKNYIDKITELTQAQKDLQDAQIEGAKSAQAEMQTARDLFAIIRDTSVSYNTRKGAIQKVLEIYPEYLGNINSEKELLGNLDLAQQRVNKGIIDSAFARIKAQEIEKRAAERVAREIELLQAQEKAQAAATARDQTKATPTTGLNTLDSKTQASISAASAASLAKELAQRNKALDDANSYYFQNFSKLAAQTTTVLSKDLSPSWDNINKQIAATKKLLATDPKNEGLQKQLVSLEKQLAAEMNSLIKSSDAKKQIADIDEKAADKAKKAAAKAEKDKLKALKDQYDLLLKETDIEQQKQLLLFDRIFVNKTITESEHNKRELQTNANHYAQMIGILRGYEAALVKVGQEGGEEYLNTQKKILEAERKLADLRNELRPKNNTVVDALPTKNTEGVTSDNTGIQAKLQSLEIYSQLEQDAQNKRFRDIIFAEQQLAIAKLEIERNYNDQKIAVLEAAGAKEAKAHSTLADQYKDAIDKRKNLDEDYTKNKERLKALEEKLEAGKIELAHSALQAGIELLSKDEAARKKHASAIKAFQIGEVVVSGIAEIQKIWKTYAELPVLAGGLTAVAAIRTAAAIGKISKQTFATGGYTGQGLGYTDHTGEQPVGTVHAWEWVSPKWMVQHPVYGPVIQKLDVIRKNGYAQGGYVNTTPSVNTLFQQNPQSNVDMTGMILEIKALRQDVSTWQTRLKADIYRDEWEAKAAQDAADRAAATI